MENEIRPSGCNQDNERKVQVEAFLILMTLVVGILCRLIPHTPNLTPVGGLALFSGFYFRRTLALAYGLPLVVLAVSDYFLGSDRVQIAVWFSFAVISWIGSCRFMQEGRAYAIGGATLASSVIFFLVTNFAVWMGTQLYPHSFRGLLSCYGAALPFFGPFVLSTLATALLLWGPVLWMCRKTSTWVTAPSV